MNYFTTENVNYAQDSKLKTIYNTQYNTFKMEFIIIYEKKSTKSLFNNNNNFNNIKQC